MARKFVKVAYSDRVYHFMIFQACLTHLPFVEKISAYQLHVYSSVVLFSLLFLSFSPHPVFH